MYPVPNNDYMSQLAALQTQLQPPRPPEQIMYVDGLKGAREEQRNLSPNSSKIVMDKNEDVFYVISSNGPIQVGRFTLESEAESEYVTKKDFNAFEQRIIALLEKGKVIDE